MNVVNKSRIEQRFESNGYLGFLIFNTVCVCVCVKLKPIQEYL